jgi:hypothetical protein
LILSRINLFFANSVKTFYLFALITLAFNLLLFLDDCSIRVHFLNWWGWERFT